MPQDHQARRTASPVDVDRFQYSMARYLIEGDERDEARVLLACRLEAKAEERSFVYDTYTMDESHEFCLVLRFYGPRKVYDSLIDQSFGGGTTRVAFERAARALMPSGFETVVVEGALAMVEGHPPDWRNELLALLDGKDVDNQAVGFKATRTYEGLRFRSESEVRVAQALDRAGVMYMPNCRARIGSLDRRRNIEADFVVMVGGKWGVLEVDGEQWHVGHAARDHERDRPFHFHGAKIVQRFDAGECFENADGVVRKFLALLARD